MPRAPDGVTEIGAPDARAQPGGEAGMRSDWSETPSVATPTTGDATAAVDLAQDPGRRGPDR